MQSEALRNIRTMRQVKTSLNIARCQKPKTSNSLSKTKEERESLGSAMDLRALGLEVRREKEKFARQDATVEKFQKNYFVAREKLAARINGNRAMMELRHELQERRRRGESPDPERCNPKEAKPPTSEGSFNEVELRY